MFDTSTVLQSLTRSRLFPSFPPASTRTPLSILDATVARFSSTSAVWIYDTPLSTEVLTQSLQETLDLYPQWSGHLRFADLDLAAQNHTKRYGRLELLYGQRQDPGLELIVSHSIFSLEGHLPREEDRAAGFWDADAGIPAGELIHPDTPLALHSMLREEPILPCAYAQITHFAKGGTAVAVKLAHPLADAQTMITFVKTWSSFAAVSADIPISQVSKPLFSPDLLDNSAAGDIDGLLSSSNIMDASHHLPIARYDNFASSEGAPAWAEQATAIPPEVEKSLALPVGRSLPWSDWDLFKPCGHRILFFSGQEVHSMWKATEGEGVRLSHLDTLLAHVWTLVNRARSSASDGPAPQDSHLYYTLDARSRVAPPLSPSFVGSPIFLAEVSTPCSSLIDTSNLAPLALQIRATLSSFDSTTVPAYLHELAHASSSQRYWNAFLGQGHAIFTSWIRQDVYSVMFGGSQPQWVIPIMPVMDGCIQISELGGAKGGDEWWGGGVAVSLNLEKEALELLLKEETLRRFA